MSGSVNVSTMNEYLREIALRQDTNPVAQELARQAGLVFKHLIPELAAAYLLAFILS